MRTIITLISIVSLFIGLSKNESFSHVFDWIEKNVLYSEITVLESKLSKEQIRKKLSNNGFNNPKIISVELHPYLVMDVKFATDSGTTKDGIVVWGLHHGEMVIETKTWRLTRGMGDCMFSGATKNDMHVLEQIYKNKCRIDAHDLEKMTNTKKTIRTLNECKKKQLITDDGSVIRIHIQDPEWFENKETLMTSAIKQTHVKSDRTMPKKFSPNQIVNFTKQIFGENFVVRSHKTVFLPVYLVIHEYNKKNTKSIRCNAITGNIYCAKVFC